MSSQSLFLLSASDLTFHRPTAETVQTKEERICCCEAGDRQPREPPIPEKQTAPLARRLGLGLFRERPSLHGSFRRSQSGCQSGSALSSARELASISPQYSWMHRSRAFRVLQKERPCQPEFFLRGFPSLRCRIHCSGSSTTLQFSLSWARSAFEGCAGRSTRSW